MEELLTTYQITDELGGDRHYHIPAVDGQAGHVTLCGYVDVIYDEFWADEHRPDCPNCIAIIRAIKNLKTGRLKG